MSSMSRIQTIGCTFRARPRAVQCKGWGKLQVGDLDLRELSAASSVAVGGRVVSE